MEVDLLWISLGRREVDLVPGGAMSELRKKAKELKEAYGFTDGVMEDVVGQLERIGLTTLEDINREFPPLLLRDWPER